MHIHRNGGRIGCPGRCLREFFNDDATAEVALEASLERKRKRGYTVRL
jgi:predicted DNA-binding WGR domain protein